MKFKVSRTSIRDDRKPCEEAVKQTYTRVEVGTLGRYIQREFPNDAVGWFVEINTLDELLHFQQKYGDIILTKDYYNPEVLELEIYDDYRE